MTTTEIYKLASEITSSEFINLFNRLSQLELKDFACLVKLGDTKEVALWTIVSKRYENKEVSEMYGSAFNL